MKCPRHPERYTNKELDLTELSMIAECPDCLEAFENQVLSEIKAGKIPSMPVSFADNVLDRINFSSHEIVQRQKSIRRLTFIHYVTAAAAAIVMTLSGGFNMVSHSASDYSAAFNRYVNEVTATTAKVSVQSVRYSLDDLIQSRLNQKTK